VVRQPGAEIALGAEEHDKNQAGNDRADGKGQVDEGNEQALAPELEFGDGPAGRNAEQHIEGNGDPGHQQGKLDSRLGVLVLQGAEIGFPAPFQGFHEHRQERQAQEQGEETQGHGQEQQAHPEGFPVGAMDGTHSPASFLLRLKTQVLPLPRLAAHHWSRLMASSMKKEMASITTARAVAPR